MERRFGNPNTLRGSAAEFRDFERVLRIAIGVGKTAALIKGEIVPPMGQQRQMWYAFDSLRSNVSRILDDTPAEPLEVTYRGGQRGPDVVDFAVGVANEQAAIHEALTGQQAELAPAIAQFTADLAIRGLRRPPDLL